MMRRYPSLNKMAHPATENKSGAPAERPADIRKLSTAELNSRAATLGVDLSGCKNNPERAELIIAAMEKAAASGNE